MQPSRSLNIYLLATFLTGVALSTATVAWVGDGEITAGGAAVLTLTWNVFFLMVLPLVLDWSQRKYFKARALDMKQLSSEHPEIAQAISQECERHSLPGLKMAVVDSVNDEIFSYGLPGVRPRIIISNGMLESAQERMIIPSIEEEIERSARHDQTTIFLLFAAIQIVGQQALIALGI